MSNYSHVAKKKLSIKNAEVQYSWLSQVTLIHNCTHVVVYMVSVEMNFED